MILLPDNENTTRHLVIFQRAEVEALEQSVMVYGDLLAKYQALLADARRRLKQTESVQAGDERR
ncbi:hypothetical protein ACFQ3Y_24900 [Paenibacillus motobuensis]|uniref:hypothetical protein n=1 Tax=Paenibacillus motobuensis TaxID=295324 RepID=UPI003645084E